MSDPDPDVAVLHADGEDLQFDAGRRALGLAGAMAAATAIGADVELRIEFLKDLSPHNVASRALALAQDCQAICVNTAVHPVVTEALEQI